MTSCLPGTMLSGKISVTALNVLVLYPGSQPLSKFCDPVLALELHANLQSSMSMNA